MTDDATPSTPPSPSVASQWKNPDFYVKGISLTLSGLIVGNVIPIASGWYKAALILGIMLTSFGFPVLMSSTATSARSSAYTTAPMHKRSAARMLGMLAGVAVAIVVALMLFAGCTSTNPRVVAGEKAAASCAVGDVLKYGGDLQSALSKPDYETQVKGIATKAGLTDAAVTCLINTVLAVVTAPSGSGASTSEPTPVVLHGRAWIAAHGTP